ncbi:hypothetical protein O6H91_10G016500 [Diphasiastrum complanatum]|uniref:Uncharacterized protein n=5 Tax=Diphasiastrum complanatum TaxID=34168 RepID=A0ACC2CFK2_DIPCM|nr:hypothetical protein O6H91_10G016500 [Diphasiastrum complanatum]KAJ7540464.1 hypothetical protein O6H91_10G016500 [Diphasiastrum complanatum]KAJ7540467.1 hypothetical protein O6H91_10G016500 [Diphasiastrum complanatum]KAJ7540468.1 hypothetical protein O6H91_10G016500 [Diphasiastrum complanatum]KAJ7540469.1 hypothetical protein O6H91_10G016500 [Diphasiastrum complanatum]
MRARAAIAMDLTKDASATAHPYPSASIQTRCTLFLHSKPFPGLDFSHVLPDLGHHFTQMGSRLKNTVDNERGRLVHHFSSYTQGIALLFRNGLHQFPAICKDGKFAGNRRAEQNSKEGFTRLGLMNGIVNVMSGLGAEQRARRRPLLACLSSALPGIELDAASRREAKHLFDVALSKEQVSKRLDGVPVYTVSNSSNEFVLVSDLTGQKSLGLFCFRQEDAEALLAQVKDREPGLGRGAKVVAVSLDKVYQLNTEGIAFRFLPDPLQVKHALQARAKGGDPGKVFDGVPVFQSDNLILRSNNRRFCPVFFCKEDLERALLKAFKKQQRGNPSLRVSTDIQVGSFEDVLKKMESNDEDSGWEDIVFIPPGMDAFNHLGKAFSRMRDTVVG